MTGFKSFGDRLRVEFHPRVTAVIGPNGSGKSNVIEAVRWASHTAKTRDLRARSSTELIFHGSSGRAPLGFAEVEIELEHLNGQGATVISRRLYRDGDSELELGKKPVRVRELQEALRGTGLGPGGLAVVGQGEIGAVVSADPEMMLGYVEEAAGVSRAAYRRSQTLERLSAARVNLGRLDNLLTELQASEARLAVEAAQASAVEVLLAETRALEGATMRHRRTQLEGDLDRLRVGLAEAECHATQETTALRDASERAANLRLEVDVIREGRFKAAEESERLLGAARLLAERQMAAERRATQIGQELARLVEDERSLAGLACLPEAPVSPGQASLELDLPLADAHSTEEAAAQSAREADRAVKHSQQLLEVARSALASRAGRKAQLDVQRGTIVSELGVLNERSVSGSATLVQLSCEAERAGLEAAAFAAVVRDSEQQVAVRREVVDIARSALAEAAARASSARRDLQRLENEVASHARYSEGPRKALAFKDKGVVGSVAELLVVPANVETAVHAALGRRLEHVVVQDGEAAQRVIEHLKRVGGRATFLPLELLRVLPRRAGPLAAHKDVLGVAADLISSPEPRLLEHLLGDTLVVRTLSAALAIAKVNPNRPRLVTLEGEIVESGGAVTGGAARSEQVSHLADTRRLESSKTEFAGGVGAEDTARTDLAGAEALLSDDQSRLIVARRASESAGMSSARIARDVDVLAARVQEAKASVRAAQDRFAKLELVDIEVLPDVEALGASLGAAQAAHADAERRLEVAREAVRALELRRKDLAADWRVFHEKERTFEQLQARRLQSERNSTVIRERREALNLERADVTRSIEDVRVRRGELKGAQDLLGLNAMDATLAGRRRELVESERDLTAATGRVSGAKATQEAQALSLARREASLEALDPKLQDAPRESPPGGPRAWAVRLEVMRAELTDIGPVNALAANDLRAIRERLQALQQSAQDAEQSCQQLESAVDELESEVAKKMVRAVQRVSDAFSAYSRDLLGGEGGLDTLKDEAGRLEGLALIVQPKGKRTRSLQLLSAGERTMAALAFLFALAAAPEGGGGLPVAILDEVDAPLDEANIRRFTHFVGLLADRGTQFVLVTHQKATMEIADAIWGVTTDASGVSRSFSIRQEAAA